MGQAILISRRNFSVNTDRWAAAAVVAIDQLPRKIASVTDTKREKNAMSEDKNNEEQRTATQRGASLIPVHIQLFPDLAFAQNNIAVCSRMCSGGVS